jgi:hypothetical protein
MFRRGAPRNDGGACCPQATRKPRCLQSQRSRRKRFRCMRTLSAADNGLSPAGTVPQSRPGCRAAFCPTQAVRGTGEPNKPLRLKPFPLDRVPRARNRTQVFGTRASVGRFRQGGLVRSRSRERAAGGEKASKARQAADKKRARLSPCCFSSASVPPSASADKSRPCAAAAWYCARGSSSQDSDREAFDTDAIADAVALFRDLTKSSGACHHFVQ